MGFNRPLHLRRFPPRTDTTTFGVVTFVLIVLFVIAGAVVLAGAVFIFTNLVYWP